MSLCDLLAPSDSISERHLASITLKNAPRRIPIMVSELASWWTLVSYRQRLMNVPHNGRNESTEKVG